MAGKRKTGRGQRSSIDLLPQDLKDNINQALRDGRLTQKEICAELNRMLEERGAENRISTSAFNRYAQQIEEDAQLLRHVQEASNAIVGRLDYNDQGDIGRALNQIVKSLTFDLVMHTTKESRESETPVSAGTLKDISLTLQRLERAAKTGIDRELKIAEAAAEKAKEAAADEAGQVAHEMGLDEKQAAFIRARILGVKVNTEDGQTE